MNLPECLLIYCQADGTTPGREVVVRHAGKRLWTCAVPLAGTAADVENAMTDLAKWSSNGARSSLQRERSSEGA